MVHFSENAPQGADGWLDARVCDAAGNQGSIVSIQQNSSTNEDEMQACIRLANGTQVHVGVGLLRLQGDGSYRLPFTLGVSQQAQPTQLTFPVMEEGVQISRRVVD